MADAPPDGIDTLLRATMADAPPAPPLPNAVEHPDERLLPKISSWREELLANLQAALRNELPAALAKELPLALSGAGVVTSSMVSRDFRVSTITEAPEAESEAMEKEESIHLGAAATYAAKKYFDEFGKKDPVTQNTFQASGIRKSQISTAELTAGSARTSLTSDSDGTVSRNASADNIGAQDLRRNQVGRMVDDGFKLQSRTPNKDHYRAALADVHVGTLQLKAFEITEHHLFTIITTVLIIVNAIGIGVQTDWMAQSDDVELPLAFSIIEGLFCIAFTTELAIRVAAYRSDFFFKDWQWNMLDATLVAFQIVEVCFQLSATSSDAGPNISFMRILRILRLVRVMRLVRVVRYISELRTIIASVFNSLKALFFTILLISLLIYTMSIALTQLVTEYCSDENHAPGEAELKVHFGSISWSSLVLFQMITNGIDWAEVATPLTNYISPFMAPCLCLYIAFTQFAMLNVITGVFVESALASDLEEKDCNMVGRLMDFLSESSNPGEISWDEFHARLEDPTIQLYFKSVDLDPREARSLFMLLDTDRTGTVDAEEFIMGCLRLRGGAKAIDLATLMYESRRWFRRVENKLNALEKNNHSAHRIQKANAIE